MFHLKVSSTRAGRASMRYHLSLTARSPARAVPACRRWLAVPLALRLCSPVLLLPFLPCVVCFPSPPFCCCLLSLGRPLVRRACSSEPGGRCYCAVARVSVQLGRSREASAVQGETLAGHHLCREREHFHRTESRKLVKKRVKADDSQKCRCFRVFERISILKYA